MELYWKLASGDASVREAACVVLLRDLRAQQQEQASLKKTAPPPEEVLLGATKDKDEGLQNCSPALQYALRRLVRGVSSSRESARQGFAMALASVLEAFPLVEVDSVLTLMKKNLEVTSSMKGQEMRDGLLGQLFALGAIVRARKLAANQKETVQINVAREITEQLLSLFNKKSFLREATTSVLLNFIDQVPTNLLQDGVLGSPLLQNLLCTEAEHSNADALLLALRLRDYFPTSMRDSCSLLPNSQNRHALFLPAHLSSLVPILKDSSSSHPRVHPVWDVLKELLFTENREESSEIKKGAKKKKKRQKVEADEAAETVDQRLHCFWSIVVDKALVTSSHERKHLAMELLCLFLPKLTATTVPLVLSKTFVCCLMDILATKGNLLYKCAEKCMNFLIEWAKKDEKRLVAVLLSLQRGSHGKFDALAKTHTSKQLVANLKSADSCFLLFENLVDLFDQEPALSISEKDEVHDQDKHESEITKSLEIQRSWVLEQLCGFVRQAEMDPELKLSLYKELLMFLCIHSLFVGSPGVKLSFQGLRKSFKIPKSPVSENMRKLCLARLQRVLVDAQQLQNKKVAFSKDGINEKRLTPPDLKLFFLEIYAHLDNLENVSRIHAHSEEEKATIDTLHSATMQLLAAAPKVDDEQSRKIRALGSLLLQILVQSITSHVSDVAMEIIICAKRAFGEHIDVDVDENDDDDENSPAHMDVLIDILLSLLAQSSAPIRAAAEQVFKSFCGDMTESALLSLLRVVKQQLRPVRQTALTTLDAEDSDGEEILEVEDSDEEMDGDDADGNTGGMDDAEQNGHHKVGSKVGNSDESDLEDAVLGANATNSRSAEDTVSGTSEDESASDSDMDDEAMFRIDAHLANLLKHRGSEKGESKDAQTQLLHFKFRVLSLLEFFLQKKATSVLALKALPHLLQAFVLSSSSGGNPQLADRLCSILQTKLFKSKQHPKGLNLDIPFIENMLQRSLNLASKSKVKKVRGVGEACSLWLLKVLHSQQENCNSKAKQLVEDALNNFFSQKKCCLKSGFFQEVFTRFPDLGTANLETLLSRCIQSRSENLQYEALSLANSILRHKAGKRSSATKVGSGDLQACLKQHLPAMSQVLETLFQNPAGRATRKLEARRFALTLLRVVSREFPKKPVQKLLGKSAYALCVSHLGEPTVEGILKSHSKIDNGEGDVKARIKKSPKGKSEQQK